jgi:threonine 3-dehydrogenase
MKQSILVTGSQGQLGSELVPYLESRYPQYQIISSDLSDKPNRSEGNSLYAQLDVTNFSQLVHMIKTYNVVHIYHLAAILSGKGEQDPQKAFQVNLLGTQQVLEAARLSSVERLFIPSSIAVYGEGYPRDLTPEDTILKPKTMYGVTKVAGELLHEYYTNTYGLDVRSIRFPGIISSKAEPGGGTTDYAVDIYYQAVAKKSYTCFLTKDTQLPFLFMPDVLHGISCLMEASEHQLSRRVYHLTGFSACPGDFSQEISNHVSDFSIDFNPDFRQSIADIWPKSLDDSSFRRDFEWMPGYNLKETTVSMIEAARQKHNDPGLQ